MNIIKFYFTKTIKHDVTY